MKVAGGRRRWMFRLVALFLVPGGLLVGWELTLRGMGYGYPTSFFLRRQMKGQDVLVENARFGLRFFPTALARNPEPMVLAARKPPGTYRIFLFGESAALGDPKPAYGMGRHLQVLLQDRFPQGRFEVVCVAMTAINSHALRLIAAECARYEGDLWIVYMGNNEMEGPFGAGTVFGPKAPDLAFVRASLALKSTRTGQWIDAVIKRLRSRNTASPVWRGMKMFLQDQVGQDDPRRQTVYRHFERNLEDIVRTGVAAGCPILLSGVASNLRDCGPFASLHRAGWTTDLEAQWISLYLGGQTNEALGDPQAALAAYQKAASLDSAYADLHFRSGLCLLRLTNNLAARVSLERARDCDSLPFRAETEINDIIRRVAARHTNHNVHWIHAQDALASYTRDGIPGGESFLEHVHLNFDGNYRIARAFAQKVEPCCRNQSPDSGHRGGFRRRYASSGWD